MVFVVSKIRSFWKIQQIRKVYLFQKFNIIRFLKWNSSPFSIFILWDVFLGKIRDNLGFEIFMRKLEFFVLVARIIKNLKAQQILWNFHAMNFLSILILNMAIPRSKFNYPSPSPHKQKERLKFFLEASITKEIWCFFIRFFNMIFPYKRMTFFSSKALKWKKNLEERWENMK